MKTIATVNTILPTVGKAIEYLSGESLRDYDIVLFDPAFPYIERVNFDAGGSCLSIDGTRNLQAAMRHWATELKGALEAGKTVFIILNEKIDDQGANGSSLDRKQRTYHTFRINNYEVLPIEVGIRNAKGRHVVLVDKTFLGLHETLKELAQYRVIVEPAVGRKILAAKDGAMIGAEVGLEKLPGKMILLPYFNLGEYDEAAGGNWSKGTLSISRALANQLVATDNFLRKGKHLTPPPEWLEGIEQPKAITDIQKAVGAIETQIRALDREKQDRLATKDYLWEFSHLLYENGKPLELAIERSLQLLGYEVQNYKAGDLEIDHIITSPDGRRMIGESEGKDNTAIDISKFRQLESNINEDFEREDVGEPAKGILFGNGYRLSSPDKREEPFTAKCVTNARRLGTALVRTPDLYKAIVYLLDHPEDEEYKLACRQAMEGAVGVIVKFPEPSANS